MKTAFLFLAALALVSCGDDDPRGSRNFAPSLNVNEIVYELREILVEAQFEYQDGTRQVFRNTFTTGSNLDEELISRKTEEDRYTLQINAQKSSVNVGASARFESDRDFRASDSCTYVGKSSSTGFAEFDSLELDYRMNLELRGSDCPDSIQTEFVETQKTELAGLNLNLVKKLQEAGIWVHDETKKVSIRIRILGVSS